MEEINLIICTYKRPLLLITLLNDVLRQSIQPSRIIIVDGDVKTDQIIKELRKIKAWPITYIQSNHPNISFQRYLGWLTAKGFNPKIILYLDDDLRIIQPNALEIIVRPLKECDSSIIGVTAPIKFGITEPNSEPVLINGVRRNRYRPGSLSPSGTRIKPDTYSEDGYGVVEWAYGGVMAFRYNSLTSECFLEDSFALHHIGLGSGEDTLISHIASFKGKILLAKEASVFHPNADEPKAVSMEPFQNGYARSYSRWLINAHLQQSGSSIINRIKLIRSLGFANILNIIQVIKIPKKNKILYAFGYLKGSVRGLIDPPSAKHLTPNIDWQNDAQIAISKQVEIK